MFRVALAIACLFSVTTLTGCGALAPSKSSKLSFEATSKPARLQPHFTTHVFVSDDINFAHIYLTDIENLGTPEARGEGMTGNILHIHMFLYPKAGKTPIDFTASNATITHVVLADGAYGIYAGGGFFLPSGKPKSKLAGRIAEATLRPIAATSGFEDLLGWNELTGNVGATRDDDRAAEIDAFLQAIIANPELAPLNE